MGKESEKEKKIVIHIYIYIYIYHFAVPLKLTQHCKSNVLQFLKIHQYTAQNSSLVP